MPGSTFTVSVRVAITDQREALIIAIVSPISFRAYLMASKTNWRIFPDPRSSLSRTEPYNDTGHLPAWAIIRTPDRPLP